MQLTQVIKMDKNLRIYLIGVTTVFLIDNLMWFIGGNINLYEFLGSGIVFLLGMCVFLFTLKLMVKILKEKKNEN